MAARSSLVVNGKSIKVHQGETLLEAALSGSIVIPHDCSTGQCDTCRVRVYDGAVDACGTGRGNTVLACQARVTGDAIIEFDAVPDVVKRAGRVTSIVPLSAEIVEVTLTLDHDFTYLPGQYVSCAFAGFPSRDYSPTLRNDGSGERNELILQIRRLSDGIVSSQLGGRIRVGHKVTVRGPFGSAFYRQGEGRLILVAAGTGWAPIWAVARAARYREPARDLIVIAGARDPANLYMGEALDWLRQAGAKTVIATSSGGPGGNGVPETIIDGLLAGRPTAHLPMLHPTDAIYAAGAPGMVSAVQLLAGSVGAECHADPFVASSQKRTLKHRFLDLIFSRRAKPTVETLVSRALADAPDPAHGRVGVG